MSKTEKPEKKSDLYYVGDGYLNGVPAADITADEIEARGLKHADLLASGLYSDVQPKKETPKHEPAEGKE